MAIPQNFRTAFNGFNREDVVHYIEFLNAKHTAEISQLNSELEYLRGKHSNTEAEVTPAAEPVPQNDVQPALIEQQAARIRELFDENKALSEKLEALKGEQEALTAQLAAAQEENARLSQNLNSAQEQQDSYKSRMEEELEAYRRAERTERLARERAEQLYRQANGALADATAKVDDAAGQIGELSDRVIAQLNELQGAVSGSKQALRDAAATMYTIRPNTGEE